MKKRAFALLMALSMVVSTLPMPVHAEEGAYYCGKTAHTHADSCYSTVKICEADEHQHGEGCFESQQELLCTLPEAHAHGEGCKDAEGNLTCPYEETHTHGDGCYTLSQQQICQIQVHTHDAAQCFSQTPVCTLEVHSHDETCLVDPNASAPVPDEEPQEETPAEDSGTYVVYGDDRLCGTYYNPGDRNNIMTQSGTVYTKTYTNVAAGDYEMKVGKVTDFDSPFSDGFMGYGDPEGGNFHFSVTAPCDVTVTFDPATKEITISGLYIAPEPQFEVGTVYAFGEGSGTWLNGATWNPGEPANQMTEVESNVFQIVFSGVNAGTYEFKFAHNGAWLECWGADGGFCHVESGKTYAAVFCSNGNYELTVPADESKVTLRLDLTDLDNSTFTATIVSHAHVWATEWCTDDTHHWHECTAADCYLTENSGKDQYEPHSYSELAHDEFLVSDATCVSGKVYYQSCNCGHLSAETFEVGGPDSNNHIGTNDKLASDNAGQHDVVWSCCNAVVTEDVTCTASNPDGSCSTAETCACGNLLIAAKDSHNLTYTASGNVITETCGWNGCAHSATATIHAPENLVFDWKQKLAAVTYSDGWAGYSLDISYSGTTNDGISYTGALHPSVRAGTVTASIIAQNDDTLATASVDYIIEKATPDIGTVSVAGSTIYPHTAITLARTDTTVPGTLALDAGQTLMVGTQEYSWTFTPDEPHNYNTVTGKVSITVVEDALQKIEITTPPTKTEYTYGEAFDTSGLVVTATFASGLTPEVTADVVCGPLNAGDTSITLSYTADGVTKTCTIENITVKKAVQAALTLTGIPAAFTYGDVFTLGTSGGSSEEAVVWSMAPADTASEVDASSGQVRIRDITPFTITAAKPGGKNYEDATATLTITPEKAMLYVTPDSYEIYEGDPMPELTYVVTGLVNGDTYSNPTLTTAKTSAEDTFDILIEEGSGTLTNAAYYQVNYTAGKLTVRAHQWASQWSNDAGYHWHECGEEDCPITQNSGKYGYGAHVKDSNGLCQDCGYIMEVKQLETQIKTSAVTVSPGLNGTAFNTVPKIEAELTRVLTSSTGYSANNVATHDVTLQYSTDGGKTWVTATEENFPVEGITVVLPYPAGTGRNSHNFKVTHMFTVTSAKLGTTAGETEQPAVTKLDSGIQVTLRGLSPVGISWKAIPTSGGSQDSGSDKVYDSDSPKTGDITQTGLWFSLAVFSLVGLTGSLAAKKHRRKR